MLKKFEDRAYQVNAINEINNRWNIGEREVVLGVCPNGGKTFMAIEIIKQHPKWKVLILPHGTTVLKEQWEEKLKDEKLSFSSNVNSAICCQLPQSLKNQMLPKFDLVIVDEGHEFVFVQEDKIDGMVQKILKQNTTSKILYLTGTPAKFIARNYIPVLVPAEDLIPEYTSDLYFGIASTTVKLHRNSTSGELTKEGEFILEEDTDQTLDRLLKAILKRLRSFTKRKPLLANWLSILNYFEKTMFACTSIRQASLIEDYLKSYDVSVLNSNEETDTNSEYFKQFQNDDSIRVLIVVRRGILGFDMPKLCNVIDITGSININRIYQLYARVMRKHENKKKYFFKVVPDTEMNYYKFFMEASLRLMSREFISIYNGTNINSCEVPARISREKHKKSDTIKERRNKRRNKIIPAHELFYGDLPVMTFMQAVFNRNDRVFNEYARCTIGEVKRMLSDRSNPDEQIRYFLDKPLNWERPLPKSPDGIILNNLLGRYPEFRNKLIQKFSNWTWQGVDLKERFLNMPLDWERPHRSTTEGMRLNNLIQKYPEFKKGMMERYPKWRWTRN